MDLSLGGIVALVVALSGVILMALDERARRKFATRDDLNGATQRLEGRIAEIAADHDRMERIVVSLTERTGSLEATCARIDERQTQQWDRISRDMARTAATIQDVTRELREIARLQHEYAVRLERIAATLNPHKEDP